MIIQLPPAKCKQHSGTDIILESIGNQQTRLLFPVAILFWKKRRPNRQNAALPGKLLINSINYATLETLVYAGNSKGNSIALLNADVDFVRFSLNLHEHRNFRFCSYSKTNNSIAASSRFECS